MIIMAVVPVVGCSIIWAPAGIIMLLTGHIWEGMLILATGVLVISTIDNLLRPVLIGKDVEMHPLMIFLSTLGGIVVFGFSGFVIGPIIASMLWRSGRCTTNSSGRTLRLRIKGTGDRTTRTLVPRRFQSRMLRRA